MRRFERARRKTILLLSNQMVEDVPAGSNHHDQIQVIDGQTAIYLDVQFISSLPVRQGHAYRAWVDSTPVQMVWDGD